MNGTNDFKEYGEAWTRKMAEIWRDRMEMLGVFDTGSLRHSLADGSFSMTGEASAVVDFRFLEYGIYVDAGTGNGYTRGNPGDLQILDPVYRHEHKMGKQRHKKPWFSKSWTISRLVLMEKMADLLGDNFSRSFDNL